MSKKFEIPEITDDLTVEQIADLRKTAMEAAAALDTGDDLSAEAMDEVEAILTHVDALDARSAEITAAETALAERREAARARLAEKAEAPADEAPADEVVEETPAAEEEAEVVEETPEPALVAAGQKRSTAAKAAAASPTVIIKKEPEVARKNVLKAAANVPEFNSGQILEDTGDLARAFLQRVSTFGGDNPKDMKAGTYKMSPRATRYGVARLTRDAGEFTVDSKMSLEQQFQAIIDASSEVNRFGSFGGLAQRALTAAGGWCSPSETIYDLFGYESNSGFLDIAEVTARRGGIQFTKGPDFMTIFGDADAGWIMTETQAESGSFVKPCYALECPPFEEVRLDAIGFCATAPLLTDAAWPELTRRVLDMLGLGHQRRKNQTTIARIVANIAAGTGAKAPVTFAPVGGAGNNSGHADLLAALDLRATQIRQSLSMDPKATIETILPFWAPMVLRSEISRRITGVPNVFAVSDADIAREFADRNLRVQFVKDLNDLSSAAVTTVGGTGGWTALPEKIDAYQYPAGAYTRLVNNVITLDAVYDHDLLTQNEYTAAFVEEGIAVANTRGYGLKTTVALNPEGLSGAANIGRTFA